MTLLAFLREALERPIDGKARALAAMLGDEADASAVLFYGSNLRTGSLDGVLDFYVLTPGPVDRGMWPTVSYREVPIEGVLLRAKIATMRLATFAKAAADETLDTTIWARFAQPSALAWTRDAAAAHETSTAVAVACVTASRYAAALGPERGAPSDYWRTLFQATYTAELRVERSGRHDELVARDRVYFETLLPLVWTDGGVAFERKGEQMRPMLTSGERQRLKLAWRKHRAAGKPINVARLIRAAATFDGAARYAAWKIERHTGVHVALTPWRERHPILAAPRILWQVWRGQAQ